MPQNNLSAFYYFFFWSYKQGHASTTFLPESNEIIKNETGQNNFLPHYVIMEIEDRSRETDTTDIVLQERRFRSQEWRLFTTQASHM